MKISKWIQEAISTNVGLVLPMQKSIIMSLLYWRPYTAEQHRVLVSHPDIPERIHSALGKNDGYWESYWETVSEVAHSIVNEYMAQNAHTEVKPSESTSEEV